MKRMTVAPHRIVAWLIALVLVSACAGYKDGSARTAGEVIDDTSIQSALKLALVNDPDLKARLINTEVNRGVVTLHGRVGSREQHQRALRLAENLQGVKSVQDRLTIVTD